MIITIIVFFTVVIGVIFLHKDHYYIGAPLVFVGTLLALICAIVILSVRVGINHRIDYENKLYEKSVIEYRISNQNDNVIGNELLYNDIVNFNNSLYNIKENLDSPWWNWFYNPLFKDIDYIKLEGIDNRY